MKFISNVLCISLLFCAGSAWAAKKKTLCKAMLKPETLDDVRSFEDWTKISPEAKVRAIKEPLRLGNYGTTTLVDYDKSTHRTSPVRIEKLKKPRHVAYAKKIVESIENSVGLNAEHIADSRRIYTRDGRDLEIKIISELELGMIILEDSKNRVLGGSLEIYSKLDVEGYKTGHRTYLYFDENAEKLAKTPLIEF